MRRKTFKWITTAAALALVFGGFTTGAWAQTPQVPMPGSSIPQWVNQLPTLTGVGGAASPRMVSKGSPSASAASPETLEMDEFVAKVLPAMTPTTPAYAGTHVFGYRIPGDHTEDTYIGPVFVTSRDTPTAVKYVNNLGSTDTTNVAVWKYSVDQTLHWADPNGGMGSLSPYSGPIPAVAHLHGGEVPAAIDGGPDAWFLNPTTGYTTHGQGYYTYNYDTTNDANNNYSIYRYPNTQEAAPIWFHDHLLGGTRINVYSGLAGAYLLTDSSLSLPAGMDAVGLINAAPNGTGTELTIPLVLQDRMFDTAGELYFPDLGINPTIHPFWIPEFVGDAIVVNGKAWPNLNLEAKRYRFLMINGSNARTYELNLSNNAPMYVIGTDGGYLDNAVPVSKLVIAPGERYQLIIDFGKYAGKKIIMSNTGRTPFPKGTPPQGSTLGRIVQFTVGPVTSFTGADLSFNPTGNAAIRTGGQIIQRLVDPATGTLNPAITVAQYRQLTLNEVIGAGGPLEILVNNTKWDGKRPQSLDPMDATPIPGFSPDGIGNYLSELPMEGTTEVWEIINTTADAHPIHLHLVQFQLLNRQNYNVNKYMKAYNAAFPGGYDFVLNAPVGPGVYIPSFGPPFPYNSNQTPAANPARTTIGGNPDVTPYLQGNASPPLANEAGWKDTVIMYPGQVTRIAVRFAPTDTAPGTTAYYPFTPNDSNPNATAGTYSNYDYVWHCHIVDHEDNEMMRPYQVDSSAVPASFTRTYVQGDAY